MASHTTPLTQFCLIRTRRALDVWRTRSLVYIELYRESWRSNSPSNSTTNLFGNIAVSLSPIRIISSLSAIRIRNMGDMGERCELNTQWLDLDDIPDNSHLPNHQTTTPNHQMTIDFIGNRLHLPTHVKDEAYRMFTNEGRFVENRNRVVVAMACVYLSCMRCFIPRTVREILPERDRDRALRKEVKRAIESLGRECPLGACDASFFGKQFSGLLKMAEPVATKVKTGIRRYQSLNLEMNPYLVAAAIVFYYANSGPDIFSVSGLSEEVIKATWAELWQLQIEAKVAQLDAQ